MPDYQATLVEPATEGEPYRLMIWQLAEDPTTEEPVAYWAADGQFHPLPADDPTGPPAGVPLPGDALDAIRAWLSEEELFPDEPTSRYDLAGELAVALAKVEVLEAWRMAESERVDRLIGER